MQFVSLEPLSHVCELSGRFYLVFQCDCSAVYIQCCAEGSIWELRDQVQAGDCQCTVPLSLRLLVSLSIPDEITHFCSSVGRDRGAGLKRCVELIFLALFFP